MTDEPFDEEAFDEAEKLEPLEREDRETRLRFLSDRDPALAARVAKIVGKFDEMRASDRALGRFQPGDVVFEKYAILSQLTERDGCYVYHASRPVSERERQPVILKTIRGRMSDEALMHMRAGRHAAMLLDPIQEKHFTGLVIEYVSEGSITRYLEDKGIETKVELFGQVCDGVQSLHDLREYHGDLKPGNILVHWTAQDGAEVRIVDFGTARLAGELGVCAGTPPYMDPRQVETRATAQSDIYSLGVLLHQILGGSLTGIGSGRLPPLPILPEAEPGSFRNVVARALRSEGHVPFNTVNGLRSALMGCVIDPRVPMEKEEYLTRLRERCGERVDPIHVRDSGDRDVPFAERAYATRYIHDALDAPPGPEARGDFTSTESLTTALEERSSGRHDVDLRPHVRAALREHGVPDSELDRPDMMASVASRLSALRRPDAEAVREILGSVEIDAALRMHPRLLLLGGPGAGKSSLARHVAYSLAAPDTDSTPLWGSLGLFAGWLNRTGRSGVEPTLLREFLREGDGAHPCRWIEAQLDHAKTTLILDGLDEVKETELRLRVAKIVRRAVGGMDSATRLLLTCREEDLTEKIRDELDHIDGLRTVRLRDLSDVELEQMIETRYSAVAGRSNETAARAAKLIAEIKDAGAHLLEIARQPLLLVCLVALHKRSGDNDPDLPTWEPEILDQCVRSLAGKWDDEKKRHEDPEGAALGAWADLDEGKRLDLLTRIGHLVFESEEEDISEGTVLDMIESVFGRKRRKQILESMISRTGFVQRDLVDGFSLHFPLKPIREFMAARWAAKLADESATPRTEVTAEALAQHLGHDGWSRVVRLVPSVAMLVAKDGEHGVEVAERILNDSLDAEVHRRIRAVADALRAVELLRRSNKLSSGNLGRLRKAVVSRHEPLAALAMGDAPGAPRDRVQITEALGWYPDVPDPRLDPADRWVSKKTCWKTADGHQFEIARWTVTVEEFREFVEDKPSGYDADRWKTWAASKHGDPALAEGVRYLSTEDGWTGPANWPEQMQKSHSHPVTGVSWYEAVAYCAWATERDPAFVVRLPTVDEWRLVATANGKRPEYPWTTDPTVPPADASKHMNHRGTELGGTSPVGSFPRGTSADGIWDLAGNVLEWCLDKGTYSDSHGARGRRRMGGCFWAGAGGCRSSIRVFDVPPGARYRGFGFRPARVVTT